MVRLTVLLSFFSFFIMWTGVSQEINFTGKVTDSLQSPITDAYILAIPINSKTHKVKYSITDVKGNYFLKLSKGLNYNVEITYLGYIKVSDTISITEDLIKNYTLIESDQTLEEVLISSRLPIKVREDTITYRVDKFTNGSERKLKDVLKKLPGVEVDREGNTTINGKPVTKLLVDGKEFFTGDEKLGVNNIPADVIDEIEALDNYSEVSFLKGLSSSEQLALNIKLKEGRKKFAFGDIEAGGGIEDRYSFHPTLFYYSPKTNVNVIGDFNNIGSKEFTLQDLINFEGGFARINEDPTAFFSLANNGFTRFLQQNNFTFNRNNFGAFNVSQKLSKTLRLDAYSIISSNLIETRIENDLVYLTGISPDENRITTQNNDLTFNLSKLQLRYIGANDLDIKYKAFLKTSNGEGISNLISQTAIDTTIVSNTAQPENVDFTQNIAVNKRFNRKHTSSLTSNFKWITNENTNDYFFNRPIFSNQIPFIDEGTDSFNLNQNTENRLSNLKANFKHYWVLHRKHHIYPEVGINIINQQYETLDQQLLSDNENSFLNSGFNNDVSFGLVESYSGITYKAKAGKFIFKPSLFYHNYNWDIQQFDNPVRNSSLDILLPRVNIDWEIKKTEELSFRYNLSSRFAEASQLANRLRLRGFNQLFRGNEFLENQLTQRLSLTYTKSNFRKGFFFNIGGNYFNRPRTIRSTSVIDGINQINTLLLSRLPENDYTVNTSFTKEISKYRILAGSDISFSNYSRNINEQIQTFNSNSFSYSLGVKTKYDNVPNLELSIRHSFDTFDGSAAEENRFVQIDPTARLEFIFWKDFVLEADYTFTYYENRTINEINRFQAANASLRYNKESSPWGIELNATNIFDIQLRNENSINQFLISDTRTFVQPRILLLKVAYKI